METGNRLDDQLFCHQFIISPIEIAPADLHIEQIDGGRLMVTVTSINKPFAITDALTRLAWAFESAARRAGSIS